MLAAEKWVNKIEVYVCNEILLSNRKEWTNLIYPTIWMILKTGWVKEAGQKRIHITWFYLHTNLKIQTNPHWEQVDQLYLRNGSGDDAGETTDKGTLGNFGKKNMFNLLVVVMTLKV